MSQPSSRVFQDWICQTHSPSAACDWCNRSHFASGENSASERLDIERWRAKADLAPAEWHETTDDCVSWGYFNGKQTVWGCPCEWWRRFEEWAWNNREMIVAYLKARSAEAFEQAEKDADLVKGA